MDLNNANKKRNTFKKGSLSQTEKDRRIKNNLCLYCRKLEYIIDDCYTKKSKGKSYNKKQPYKQFNIAELILTNRTLNCVNGPKVEIITIDNGKITITGYTSEFIYIKTNYYKAIWYIDITIRGC